MTFDSIREKTLLTLLKAILGQDDFNDDYMYQQIERYVASAPVYVRLFIWGSIIYSNALSLLSKYRMLHSLKADDVVALLNKCEKHFVCTNIVMVLKLISTLVYFDNDKHAQRIGYHHLEHCK
jgi:hypothetical protein